ncbi:hypothetical protein B0J12DRAFT_324861 [Macrophomina phaseolina]|uniref:Uncharacterized protein n=1 Tax=Macrophomina phaseolina TaxID=35725 RepID=A0ABQ8FVG0_9PEZI|nr:hypothetical protein B0J12DRAFT_324861 [Macrophomina phaseolina]
MHQFSTQPRLLQMIRQSGRLILCIFVLVLSSKLSLKTVPLNCLIYSFRHARNTPPDFIQGDLVPLLQDGSSELLLCLTLVLLNTLFKDPPDVLNGVEVW